MTTVFDTLEEEKLRLLRLELSSDQATVPKDHLFGFNRYF